MGCCLSGLCGSRPDASIASPAGGVGAAGVFIVGVRLVGQQAARVVIPAGGDGTGSARNGVEFLPGTSNCPQVVD